MLEEFVNLLVHTHATMTGKPQSMIVEGMLPGIYTGGS